MVPVLNHPLRPEEQRRDKRDREKDVNGCPRKVDPEVADRVWLLPGESTDERDRDSDSGRRRHEILDSKAGHLDEIAKRALARVRLPICIGHEADSGIEREIRANLRCAESLRVQWKPSLQPLNQVKDRKKTRS